MWGPVYYNYFRGNYGESSVPTNNANLQAKYGDAPRNKLKKILRKLKSSSNDSPEDKMEEIKFVSHLLRSKLNPTGRKYEFDHNREIKKNYWKYCKDTYEKEDVILPSFFDEDKCYNYFRNIFREKNPSRNFELPSWIKTLNEPTNPFNLESPTYKEIQKIISKMKSSGSPCPFDHLSVIVLKNWPILRTQVWRICTYCWMNRYFPEMWKNSTTILIHKKDSPEEPSNFRPITLEPIVSKIMTSLIRNRLFSFVLNNKFVECNIQKGFWTGITGTRN